MRPYVTHTDGCSGKCGTAFDNPPCPGADALIAPLERISREAPEWVQVAAVDVLSWVRDDEDLGQLMDRNADIPLGLGA